MEKTTKDSMLKRGQFVEGYLATESQVKEMTKQAIGGMAIGFVMGIIFTVVIGLIIYAIIT